MKDTQATQMKMMNSLSKEKTDSFLNWLNHWDSRIETHDDRETQFIITEKLKRAFGKIEYFLSKSDEKVMLKARGNLIPGSNDANEKEVLAMFENQKKDWYKDFKKISGDMTYIRCILDNIYELKNRRSYECFKLRTENSKLRAELKKLRNQRSS